jgi:hypothetical protein
MCWDYVILSLVYVKNLGLPYSGEVFCTMYNVHVQCFSLLSLVKMYSGILAKKGIVVAAKNVFAS